MVQVNNTLMGELRLPSGRSADPKHSKPILTRVFVEGGATPEDCSYAREWMLWKINRNRMIDSATKAVRPGVGDYIAAQFKLVWAINEQIGGRFNDQ